MPNGRSLPVRLRNQDSAHCLRPILFGLQLVMQRRHESGSPPGRGLDLLDRDPIHPRRTVVVGDQGPGGLQHVEPRDQAIQCVKPERRLSLRLQVQLLSQRGELRGQPRAVERRRGFASFSSSAPSSVVASDILSRAIGPPRV